MNLVTFNPEHTLDRLFETDRFFGFPRANLDRFAIIQKVNILDNF